LAIIRRRALGPAEAVRAPSRWPTEALVLEIALGDYPHTRELKSRLAGSPSFNFVNIQPITKAFAPMARQQAYDISEMALVTFLQAKAYGKPLVLLPVLRKTTPFAVPPI
jgi:4,5-dihydroxyphthalate decarboxylase